MNLGHDAAEIVRRAEVGLSIAVKRGQEAGVIVKRGDIGRLGFDLHRNGDQTRPLDYFDNHGEQTAANAMAAVDPEVFDAAIGEAKAEGNLSRANVVRKVTGLATLTVPGVRSNRPCQSGAAPRERPTPWHSREQYPRMRRASYRWRIRRPWWRRWLPHLAASGGADA